MIQVPEQNSSGYKCYRVKSDFIRTNQFRTNTEGEVGQSEAAKVNWQCIPDMGGHLWDSTIHSLTTEDTISSTRPPGIS